MKIKYYLRGLGIGILLTTVILGISFGTRSKNLSDEEIMNKAEALGMVREEDTLPPKNQKEPETTTEPEDPKPQDSESEEAFKPEEGSKPQETAEMEAGEGTTPSETTEAEEKENSSPSETPDTSEEDSKKAQEDNEEALPPEKTEITFTISSGMWSEDVSRILKSAGLVDDAVEFNTYLKNNGYQSKIQTGNYTMEKGADFKEIADKITKR